MKDIRIVLMLAGIVAAQPTFAREWPDVKGWQIIEGTTSCGARMTYEGNGSISLLIILSAKGKASLTVANYNWLIKEGETFDVRWSVNGNSYTGEVEGTILRDGRHGILGTFVEDLLDDLAKGDSLRVDRGDALIDNVTLTNSAAAISVAKQCRSAVRSRLAAEAGERARLAPAPTDSSARTSVAEPK